MYGIFSSCCLVKLRQTSKRVDEREPLPPWQEIQQEEEKGADMEQRTNSPSLSSLRLGFLIGLVGCVVVLPFTVLLWRLVAVGHDRGSVSLKQKVLPVAETERGVIALVPR